MKEVKNSLVFEGLTAPLLYLWTLTLIDLEVPSVGSSDRQTLPNPSPFPSPSEAPCQVRSGLRSTTPPLAKWVWIRSCLGLPMAARPNLETLDRFPFHESAVESFHDSTDLRAA